MSPCTKSVFLSAFSLAAAAFLLTGGSGSADPKQPEPIGTALYHRDRNHVWNRVHAALLMRSGPDGKAYGEDRLEPLLWRESEHLLKGKPADGAVAVLEEFAREKGETLLDDQLKRAILQRDLWLVFNWLAGKPDADRKRLAAPLAQVILRLALTPEQIAKMPDNYAAAVAAKRFADRFDPEKPERSYLPPDLFQPDGTWVCIGRPDGRTAPAHLAHGGTNAFTNSTFLTFLKLPGGRAATLDFLKRLAAFDKPLYVPNTDEESHLRNLPNPALPQWPKGTEVALVRRALLIDTKGRVVASPLTESVQLRVMRTDTPALTAKVIDGFQREGIRQATPKAQAFSEFQLRRTALFAGEDGGLRDVSEERDFKTGFNAHQWDEFSDQPSPASPSAPFPERSLPFKNNRASCIGCHQFPGVYSFNTFHQDFPFTVGRGLTNGRDGDYVPRSHSLAPMAVEKVERAAVKWKEDQPAWKALRKLLPE